MKTGYLSCRLCGAETNCVELTAGLCPACAKIKGDELAALHRCFDRKLAEGDAGAAALAVEDTVYYDRLYGVRLAGAPSVAAMRAAVGRREGRGA